MSSEWRTVKLVDIAAKKRWALNGGPFGSKLSRKHYSEAGVPVIRGTNLPADSRFSFEDFVYVSEEKADELRANNAHPGDLIFTQRGTIGQVGLIPLDSPIPRFVISQSQMKLTVDPEQAAPEFLYYFFSAADTVQRIQNLAFAAGVPHINLDILRKFETPVPPLPVQRRIAGILSAYDELIENSQRRIRILETMARALYREWFVHFRFPGHENHPRVASPLGEIPRGWEVKSIQQFGTVITGKTPSKTNADFYGNDVPFVKTPDMHGNMFILGTSDCLSTAGAESQANKTLPAGSICVSCIGTIGVVSITTVDCQTNQQINSVVLANPAVREFLFLRLQAAKQTLENLGANGATMGNVNKGKFEAMEIVCPSGDLLAHYHRLVEPMFLEILSLCRQIQNLRRTRDLLLPRLVSGQVELDASATAP